MTRKELLIQEAARYIDRLQPRGLSEAKNDEQDDEDDDEHNGDSAYPSYDPEYMYHKSGPYEVHSDPNMDDRSEYTDHVFHDGEHLGSVTVSKENEDPADTKADIDDQLDHISQQIPNEHNHHFLSISNAIHKVAQKEVHRD